MGWGGRSLPPRAGVWGCGSGGREPVAPPPAVGLTLLSLKKPTRFVSSHCLLCLVVSSCRVGSHSPQSVLWFYFPWGGGGVVHTTRRPSLGGLSSYLFVLACCEGLGRMLSLVLGVSKPMFVSGPGRGGGVPFGSEACGGGGEPHAPSSASCRAGPCFRGRQPTLGSAGRALGWKAPPSAQCKCPSRSLSSSILTQPDIHLVLKALGSERPVLGWRVGFPRVTGSLAAGVRTPGPRCDQACRVLSLT